VQQQRTMPRAAFWLMLAGLVVFADAARAQHYECSEETYRKMRPKVESLFGSGVLRKDPHSTGAVLVLDTYWAQLTTSEKQRFADRLVCAMAGTGKTLSRLTLKSLATGTALGEWTAGTLSVR
jgi:hypothetical protein